MDEALLDTYRRADYRVRLGRGGWASIRVGERLPSPLAATVAAQAWGFITAWHPFSTPAPHDQNRRAQRRLLHALRSLPTTCVICAGLGAGIDGWREPSLFVVGPRADVLDALAVHFGQNAYLHGLAGEPARLRVPPC